jgi:hypothetical protein
MSDVIDESTEFDVGPEELHEEGQPLVQCYVLDGGYVAATISLAGDPEAPNLAEQVKTRLVLAHTAEALTGLVTSCLVADYGMTQDDAEQLERLTMVEGEVTPEEPGPGEEEVVPEEPGGEIDNTLPEGQEPPVDPPMVQPTSWEEPQREA